MESCWFASFDKMANEIQKYGLGVFLLPTIIRSGLTESSLFSLDKRIENNLFLSSHGTALVENSESNSYLVFACWVKVFDHWIQILINKSLILEYYGH